MKYMLDTNICIYAIKNDSQVLAKLSQHINEGLYISAVVKAEIEYGIHKSANYEKNRLAFERFLKNISVLPFDESAAKEYGEIRAQLEQGNDLFIAAHCRTLNYVLVSHNLKEFSRVKNLKIEDWTTGAEK